MRKAQDKLIAFSAAQTHAATLRSQGRALVTTNGCFDLLHLGHLNYLASARELGDVLWIAINSDASVRRNKADAPGERPILPECERAEVLAALRPSRPIQDERTRAMQLAALEAVDFVTVFDEATPEAFLALVKPAVHVKGGDYRPEDLPEAKVVQAAGGRVQCLAFTPGCSTTDLIERIKTSSQ